MHESVPIYSGGLGVLSGDHLKSASDLGLPLSGVGLMYREGYFRQYLTVDGWQQERYPENDFFNLPLFPEANKDGSPILVTVQFPGHDVSVPRLARAGRPRAALLARHEHPAEQPRRPDYHGAALRRRHRHAHPPGDDPRHRRRAGPAGLGRRPVVCHMNEGHGAFCGLERIRTLIEETGVDFATAREAVAAGAVFTTHTPVPAGNDVFSPQLIEHYFSSYFPQLKLDRHEFLGLGRQNPNDNNELFGMTVLAIRLANVTNGVSKLHGTVSRKMWKNIWPDLPVAEVPITSITNGIHTRSWLSADMIQLYDRYLGIHWESGAPSDAAVWKRVETIPDAELWRTHERRRERLVAFARGRLKQQLRNRGAPPAEIARADEILDPEALTIGFARRFATYKRGTLLFRNLERLAAILNHKDRPVQIMFSGKAHPRDHGGKELIAEILHVARRPEFRRRIVFLEDYDMNVARYLVQGVDVWLNNPRRPLEASGTSGMKVAANGGLNLQRPRRLVGRGLRRRQRLGHRRRRGVHRPDLPGRRREPGHLRSARAGDRAALLHAAPATACRAAGCGKMKRSIATLCPVFNTGRMVAEYMTRCYGPSAERFLRLTAEKLARASSLAKWRGSLQRGWGDVKVESVETQGADPMHVGGALNVKARVRLGKFRPEDVEVQLFHGLVDSLGEIPKPGTVSMSHNGHPEGGTLAVYRDDPVPVERPARFRGARAATECGPCQWV